ncbi:hypothetical protein EDEG_04150 [Edhazardia aedis USNM 41457]|uniref:Uncharacterized protein n=1 Tax=Edhazardia aedis (strain USNM 41457) TaxID=1003232 RepID=J9DAZ2_EDHAE|nr:hypothetical protein EDEG_04150 [Edhazardia aedis USNM 41457]|eukprot:EJW04941.1 hypothetical protein EDEG_04150 [Edhazardia aedis USNM 41457]
MCPLLQPRIMKEISISGISPEDLNITQEEIGDLTHKCDNLEFALHERIAKLYAMQSIKDFTIIDKKEIEKEEILIENKLKNLEKQKETLEKEIFEVSKLCFQKKQKSAALKDEAEMISLQNETLENEIEDTKKTIRLIGE